MTRGAWLVMVAACSSAPTPEHGAPPPYPPRTSDLPAFGGVQDIAVYELWVDTRWASGDAPDAGPSGQPVEPSARWDVVWAHGQPEAGMRLRVIPVDMGHPDWSGRISPPSEDVPSVPSPTPRDIVLFDQKGPAGTGQLVGDRLTIALNEGPEGTALHESGRLRVRRDLDAGH